MIYQPGLQEEKLEEEGEEEGGEGRKMIVLNLSLILSRVRTMKDVNTGEEPEEKPLPVFYQNTSKKKKIISVWLKPSKSTGNADH